MGIDQEKHHNNGRDTRYNDCIDPVIRAAGKTMKTNTNQKAILATAWAAILLVSLPNIVLQEVFHLTLSEDWYYWMGGLIVVVGFILTILWRAIRPLRNFFGLFIVLLGVQWLFFTQIEEIPAVNRLLTHPSFNVYMPSEMVLKLIVTVVVIGYLFLLKKKPSAFFLTKGDLKAAVEPVKWLGVKSEEKWSKFGAWLALFLSLGTLTFLLLSGRPAPDMVIKALPFLPAVLFAAVLNAFNEEMTYKASFLSVLKDVVGKQQALWLMAAFFGLLHFYGIPYGIIGVILATFLGWLLGKSMLETRGLFWAWFLHFLQDVLIFGFLAINAITPGG